MNKRAAAGIAVILLGIALAGAGLGVYLSQEKQDAAAGNSADRLWEDFMTAADPDHRVPPNKNDGDSGNQSTETGEDMAVLTLDGYDVVGVLTVPKLNINLPILSQWDYTLLKIAPCRYSGTAQGGDLILLGHNYKSHFRPLGELVPGDEVTFTAADGTVYRYAVALVETLHKSESERLPSDYALSVFTCTPGGANRIVVRCSLMEEE